MKQNNIYLLLLLAFILTARTATAQGGVSKFQYLYGGAQKDVANTTLATADGNYLVGGSTQSFGNFTGDINAYLVKADDNGHVVWAHSYGVSGAEEIMNIAAAADGSFYTIGNYVDSVTGVTSAQLMHVSSSGELLYSRLYNIFPNTWGLSIKMLQGNMLIAGKTYNSAQFDMRAFLVMVDMDGNIGWSQTYNSELAYTDAARCISSTPDGGYLLTGDAYNTSTNDYRILVVKTDNAGNAQWTKTYASSPASKGLGGYAYDAGYIIGGQWKDSTDGTDMLMIGLDDTGAVLRAFNYGGTKDDLVYGFAKLDSTYAFVGETESFNAAHTYNAGMLEIKPNGNIVTSKTYGAPSLHTAIYGMTIGMNKSTVMAGYMKDGGFGEEDMYLVKSYQLGGPCHDSVVFMHKIVRPVSMAMHDDADISPIQSNDQANAIGNGGSELEVCYSLDTTHNVGLSNVNTVKAISVYPNPSDGVFTLQGMNVGAVKIFNLAGADVTGNFNSTATAAGVNFKAINYVPGIYWLRVQDNMGNTSTIRMILQ